MKKIGEQHFILLDGKCKRRENRTTRLQERSESNEMQMLSGSVSKAGRAPTALLKVAPGSSCLSNSPN